MARTETCTERAHSTWRREYLAIIALAGFGLALIGYFLYLEQRLTGGLGGVPLDDSWIHYRFAKNLRAGQGFSFNPEKPTPGSTAPLWVAILSLVGGEYLIPSKVLSVLAYLGSAMMVALLAGQAGAGRVYAFLAGAGALAAGRLAWAAPSGMETAAFTLTSLLALWLWGRAPRGESSTLASLVFGLACLLRPEGYLLLALSACTWAIHNRPWEARQGPTVGKSGEGQVQGGPLIAQLQGLSGACRPILRHLILAGLVALPYLIFSLTTSGRLLPNTFYVKSFTGSCQPGLNYFLWILSLFVLDNPLLAWLGIYGLARTWRVGSWRALPQLALGGAWLVALPLAYGFIAPCISGYYTRYTTPTVPVMMVFAALGGQELEAALQRRRGERGDPASGSRVVSLLEGILGWIERRESRPGLAKALMVEGLLLGLIPTLLFWAPYYAWGVADIQAMHVSVGRWLAAHTAPGDVLALNDVGAIGFLADREVIDLMGLISPEVTPMVSGRSPGEWDAALAEYLRQRRPEYLVIFPDWFPSLAERLPAECIYRVSLPPRRVAGIPGITVAGGGEMLVYRLDWNDK